MIRISEIIKYKDKETYSKLQGIHKSKESKIQLGDTTENLMKHNQYKRVGRRVRQIK